MAFSEFIGIDISKLTLDVCLITGDGIIERRQCANDPCSLNTLFVGLRSTFGLAGERTLVCCEHTGHYTYPLITFCTEHSFNLWVEDPAAIKHCSGIQRGKDDKADAFRIACYAQRYQDKVRLFRPVDEHIETLNYLVAERRLLVADRAKYLGQLTDHPQYMPPAVSSMRKKRTKELIVKYDKLIAQIEKQIEVLLDQEGELKRQFSRLTSVAGIGPQVALATIIATKGFTAFTDARKFCCHAGVAPFAWLSGSSQRSRWKVSHRADKNLKRLYHLAAISVIRYPGELREYYQRKVAEGKPKMSVLNAIRGKLIHRVFAVIKNDRPYQKDYKNHLVLS